MPWFLLLLLLVGVLRGFQCDGQKCDAAEPPRRLAFRRQVFDSEKTREITLFMFAESVESMDMHVLIAFAFHSDHYHNALIINPLKRHKFLKLGRQCEFALDCEMIVHAKDGQLHPLQFQVAQLPHFLTSVVVNAIVGTKGDFDSVLSLDPYSSIWNDYNTMIFDQSLITFERKREPHSWVISENDRSDFKGVYRLKCARKHHSRKHCFVKLKGATLNGRPLDNHTNLIIDLNSHHNYLPYDLFIRYQFHDEKDLYIHDTHHGLSPHSPTLLLINRQFKFLLNEGGTDIVLGVDVIHYFQRVEVAMEFGYITLSYATRYESRQQFEANQAVIYLFISLVLTSCSWWCSSGNFDIFTFLLAQMFPNPAAPPPPQKKKKKKKQTTYAHSGLLLGWEDENEDATTTEEKKVPRKNKEPMHRIEFPFPYQLVAVELLILITTFVIWILILVFTDELSDSHHSLSTSVYQQRKLLILTLSLYHVIFSIFIFIYTRTLLYKTLWHYYAKMKYLLFARELDLDYEALKRSALEECEKVQVKEVLMRNLTCHTMGNTNFLLIMNFLSEEKSLYNIPFIIAALALLYCYTKTLFTTFVFLVAHKYPPRRLLRKELGFIGAMTLSGVVFYINFGFSVYPFYTAFLVQLNNFFPLVVIDSIVAAILCFVAVGAALSIFHPLTKHLHHQMIEKQKTSSAAAVT
jgi:hypothetical protein